MRTQNPDSKADASYEQALLNTATCKSKISFIDYLTSTPTQSLVGRAQKTDGVLEVADPA
jgi:hypothetical protein